MSRMRIAGRRSGQVSAPVAVGLVRIRYMSVQ